MAHYFYALIFFLLAQVCIHWNNQLLLRMINAVNAHRPLDQQIPATVMNRKLRQVVESEFVFHYPESGLRTWRTVSLNLGFLAFVLTGVMFFL